MNNPNHEVVAGVVPPLSCRYGYVPRIVKGSVGMETGRRFYSCGRPLASRLFCNLQVFIDPPYDLRAIHQFMQLQHRNDQLRRIIIHQWERIDLLIREVEELKEQFVSQSSDEGVDKKVESDGSFRSPVTLNLFPC